MATSGKQRKRAEPARPPARRREESSSANSRQKHADGAVPLEQVFSDTFSIKRQALELQSAISALREREDELAARTQVEAALKASESALKQAQHLAVLGSWEWNIRMGEHTWSEEILSNLRPRY